MNFNFFPAEYFLRNFLLLRFWAGKHTCGVMLKTHTRSAGKTYFVGPDTPIMSDHANPETAVGAKRHAPSSGVASARPAKRTKKTNKTGEVVVRSTSIADLMSTVLGPTREAVALKRRVRALTAQKDLANSRHANCKNSLDIARSRNRALEDIIDKQKKKSRRAYDAAKGAIDNLEKKLLLEKRAYDAAKGAIDNLGKKLTLEKRNTDAGEALLDQLVSENNFLELKKRRSELALRHTAALLKKERAATRVARMLQ